MRTMTYNWTNARSPLAFYDRQRFFIIGQHMCIKRNTKRENVRE